MRVALHPIVGRGRAGCDVVAAFEEWENENARVKPIFEVHEATIGGNTHVQVTMPDGTSDQIYGFDSRDEASEWIEIERREWLKKRRSNQASLSR
jgi:hypothetical protein